MQAAARCCAPAFAATPVCSPAAAAAAAHQLITSRVQVVWNAYLSTLSHAPELEIDPSKLADKVRAACLATAPALAARAPFRSLRLC